MERCIGKGTWSEGKRHDEIVHAGDGCPLCDDIQNRIAQEERAERYRLYLQASGLTQEELWALADDDLGPGLLCRAMVPNPAMAPATERRIA